MACAEHLRLESDVAQAEAALKNLIGLKASNPNVVRDEDFLRLGGLVTDANYKLRTHVTTCSECSNDNDSTAG